MIKYFKFFLIFILLIILILSISCTGKENPTPKQSSSKVSASMETAAMLSGEEFSIQLVRWSLTKELSKEKNKWKAVKYGIGYIVDFEDAACWYVEKDVVYNLNYLAVTYAKNNKNYYGIDWEKLFGIKTEDTTQESQATETTPATETAVQQETTAETTAQQETTETTVSSVFKFSYINTLPAIWGSRIRIVEPAIVSFSDVVLGPHSNVIQITGNITGSSYIEYCLKPDLGIYIQISAVIMDKNGNVNWQQNGYPLGEGQGNAYIKAGEVKNFQLTNSYISPVNVGDELIIIAYIQGGMPEDDATTKNNIDKCIYGSCIATLYGTTTTETTVETTAVTTSETTHGTTTDTTPVTNPIE